MDSKASYIDHLNAQQRDAVLYCDGPQLVIAGAGSGKTRVLTYKILHLLANGYEPWRIMALTFTNKAAREMRERIEKLVGSDTARKLWMGTFHSLFARILRANAERVGYKSNFTIYDSADSKSLVKTIIKDLQLDDRIYKPSTVLQAISAAKNALISPEEYRHLPDVMEADRRARRGETFEIYRIYRDRCLAACAMDFDDLLYYTNILMRDNPDVCRHYQEFFRYILVDEYQDTNFAQHAIITRLTSESGKLCVVGDDAQSIYSFRGANIKNILTLQNTYPTLRIFKLEQNYRSTQTIIDAANSLIDKNTQQIRKKVFSENEQGGRIELVSAYSDFEEAALVANRISQVKMETAESYEEFAVLYRTNAQSRVLEESLRKRNIPYRIWGGLSFYQRKEVKDAIAYFRLAINPADDEALRRVINVPKRSIGDTTVAKLTRTAIDNNMSIWGVMCDPTLLATTVNAGTAKKLVAFRDMVAEFGEMNARGDDAYTIAKDIIMKTGLLAQYLSDHTPESISKRENIEELLNGVKLFVDQSQEEGDPDASLSRFMGEVSLATDQDIDDGSNEERVTLMTMHAAKGLEFSNIFIVGAEEELLPSRMSCDSFEGIEEERRLLYVALTRAKRFCMMSYAQSRFRNGQTCTCSPSRFLRDIDPRYLRPVSGTAIEGPRHQWLDSYRSSAMSREGTRSAYRPNTGQGISRPLRQMGGNSATATTQAPARRPSSAPSGTDFRSVTAADLSEGMRIAHKTFGKGSIVSIDTSRPDHRIVVDFDNTGEKILLLKFARIQIL